MKKTPVIVISLATALIVANAIGLFLLYRNQAILQAQNDQSLQQVQRNLSHEIKAVRTAVSELQGRLTDVSNQSAAAALSAQELANRQDVAQKSQTQSVTDAVAKALPAVVSIVISKNVPQYQVQYQDPFGNDPFFSGFGMQIPVYVPTGKTESQKVGAGTGFLITADGYILTNRHVVADDSASYTVLLSDGKQKTAQIIYKDPKQDLAIVKIDGTGYHAVNLGDSASLQLGQTVIAIGNALGQYNNSVSVGVISGLNRALDVSGEDGSTEALSGVIQTDASINPGNSGGPLLNLSGEVVGVNVATVVGSQSIGFSVPINMAKTAITEKTALLRP